MSVKIDYIKNNSRDEINQNLFPLSKKHTGFQLPTQMNCDGGLGRLSDIKDVRGKARLITNSTVNKSMYNSSVDWQGKLANFK
mmetsp:Transcript_7099/g.8067  ORF Transcript_7099/g.8067 Transcript_7099/m.8067 type:complete len:83 (-) Transcript_7099:385-633(-)